MIRFVRLLSGDPFLSLRQLLVLDKEIRLFSDNGDFCLDEDSFRSRQRDSFVLIVPIGGDSNSGLVRFLLDFLCRGTLTVILCELGASERSFMLTSWRLYSGLYTGDSLFGFMMNLLWARLRT